MKQAQQRLQPGSSFRRDIEDAGIRAVEGEDRTFELSFSSEARVTRWGWTEILCHDEGAVDLQRINDLGVGLFNHNRDYVLGKVIDARLDAATRRCRAKIRFDTDEQAELIRQKVESGTLCGVSVGYRVDVWEEVTANSTSTNGRFAGPCDVATRWTPLEISIVSVPADDSVGVGRSHAVPLTADAPKSKRERELFLLSLSPKG